MNEKSLLFLHLYYSLMSEKAIIFTVTKEPIRWYSLNQYSTSARNIRDCPGDITEAFCGLPPDRPIVTYMIQVFQVWNTVWVGSSVIKIAGWKKGQLCCSRSGRQKGFYWTDALSNCRNFDSWSDSMKSTYACICTTVLVHPSASQN